MKQFIRNMMWLGRERQLAREWKGDRLLARVEGRDINQVTPYSAARYIAAWSGVWVGVALLLGGLAVGAIYFPLQVYIFLGIAFAFSLAFYIIWSIVNIASYEDDYSSQRIRNWWNAKQKDLQEGNKP